MNKTITLTDEQFAALQSGESITIEPPKSKRWEPQGGPWFVSGWGEAMTSDTEKHYRLFGVECDTKKQAETEANAMRSRNIIAAYVREFAPDWVANWNDSTQKKYSVFLDGPKGKRTWHYGYCYTTQSACEVYMPEHVARELSDKLTRYEVVVSTK